MRRVSIASLRPVSNIVSVLKVRGYQIWKPSSVHSAVERTKTSSKSGTEILLWPCSRLELELTLFVRYQPLEIQEEHVSQAQ